jgi:hypothetical protein
MVPAGELASMSALEVRLISTDSIAVIDICSKPTLRDCEPAEALSVLPSGDERVGTR